MGRLLSIRPARLQALRLPYNRRAVGKPEKRLRQYRSFVPLGDVRVVAARVSGHGLRWPSFLTDSSLGGFVLSRSEAPDASRSSLSCLQGGTEIILSQSLFNSQR